MGFMQRQVVFGTWVVVDCVDGVWTYPSDIFINVPVGGTQIDLDDCSDELYRFTVQVCDYVSLDNCDINFIEIIEGWGARLSAPGYLDCTDWAVHDTEAEAHEYLTDMYGDDDD